MEKTFLTNKGCFREDQISIEINGELERDEKSIIEVFNGNCINTVEKSSGTKSPSVEDSLSPLLDETAVGKTIDTYRDRPSVIAIKSSFTRKNKFKLLQGYSS